MRFVLPLIWVGACGALAACGSTQGPTTTGQAVDASDAGNTFESGASPTPGDGSSGSAGPGSSGGTSSSGDDGSTLGPSDASGAPPVDGSGGSSGDSQSPGADAAADGPPDASGLAHVDGSASSDGGAGITEAGGSEAGSDAGKDAAITDGSIADAAILDAHTTDTGVTDAGSDSANGDAASPQCKRGIASNAAPGSVFSPSSAQPGVSWWYNWSPSATGQGAGIEFVPMMWGTADLNSSLPSGSKYVLGFNEPNFTSQSDLTAAQAAADWPSVESAAHAVGALIVSPAVNFCGSSTDTTNCSDPAVTDPYTWLKDFFADCSGCEVDAIAIHWYNCDLPSLTAYIEGNIDAGGGLQGFVQFGRPIWLTEFSCDGSQTEAEQKAYMQAAVPYLESNPHIFRYSWFSAGSIPNAELANSDGTLNDLGMTYVGLPQSCP
jgi:hypothetical protein